MLSSLFRPRSKRLQSDSSNRQQRPTEHDSLLHPSGRANATVSHENIRDGEDDDDDDDDYEDDSNARDLDEEDDLDGPAALLPLFSAAHLDAIPVYGLTHAVRLLIVQRCETTLSWDQLRSPQISQFLVKPIQTKIRASHFSRATLYALIANCLQFQKEAQLNPAIVGICKTRALVAELLAVRLLREYSTHELIDALSYDFDPLSQAGARPSPSAARSRRTGADSARSSRTSTLEVAIRAQAKRFLAHPVVVRHLEAIWAGAVTFHNSADALHRQPCKPKASQTRHYGATFSPTAFDPETTAQASQKDAVRHPGQGEAVRRSVTLYVPGNASPFKLSRLRVPRYRQLFSMVSYAVMLGLFLAVLAERSYDITALEVVFWFWSAGFMLDEVVGFTEQGFGLYIMSVWNALDIGILLLFMAYYVLRLYGIVVAADHGARVAAMAYDTLASSAVLLFPRMFSLLDHYRYFSQLLIAFRLMAQDLVAVLVLIVISCSGFFVAFTMSFSDDQGTSSSRVAYSLFQILMGFTPAAWDVWDRYNALGKTIMTLFLIICHFLVVTILVSVLTNSFMAVHHNAEEEHQFLFAVNTISMVKSDALFSYIAPTNIVGWMFSPLRHVMAFRDFVKFNRTLIKITHTPVLFLIFGYERFLLSPYVFDPSDDQQQHERQPRRGRRPQRPPTFSLSRGGVRGVSIFSPGSHVREPSATTYFKDRALDEVFRRPFQDSSRSRQTSRQPITYDGERRSSAVDDWMSGVGKQGGASPPDEQPRSILEQLEARQRPTLQRSKTSNLVRVPKRDTGGASRSALSDPEDHPGSVQPRQGRASQGDDLDSGEVARNSDDGNGNNNDEGDGDDEFVGNEDDDKDTTTLQQHDSDGDIDAEHARSGQPRRIPRQGLAGKQQRLSKVLEVSPDTVEGGHLSSPSRRPTGHNRNTSTNTILFRPLEQRKNSVGSTPRSSPRPLAVARTPNTAFRSSPPAASTARRTITAAARARPSIYSRSAAKHLSAPNVQRFLELSTREARRQPSMDTIALDLASDIGDNREAGGHYGGIDAGLTGSFQTSFFETIRRRQGQGLGQGQGQGRGQVRGGGGRKWDARGGESSNQSDTMGRLVLARMNTLEEGFRDMLNEVKEWRSADASRAGSQQASGNESSRTTMTARLGSGTFRRNVSGPRGTSGIDMPE